MNRAKLYSGWNRFDLRELGRLLLLIAVIMFSLGITVASAHNVAGVGGTGVNLLTPLRPDGPAAPGVALDTFPPMAAPGAAIPVSWIVAGGATATNVRLLWDTTSHDGDNLYSNMTTPQSGGMQTYYATIGSPRTNDTIYIKARATIDGTDYFSAEAKIGRELRINSAAPGTWQDTSGAWWYGDRAFVAHSWGYEGGTTAASYVPIGNTTEDTLYQTQRQGTFRYRVWLSNGAYQGRYRVELHFAELQVSSAGQRVFNVQLEGHPVLQNFDIYAAAGGAYMANVQTFDVQVMDDELDIDFIPVNGAPAVNAIRVTGLEAGTQFCLNEAVIRSCDDTTYSGSNQHNASTMRLGGTNVDSGVRFLNFAHSARQPKLPRPGCRSFPPANNGMKPPYRFTGTKKVKLEISATPTATFPTGRALPPARPGTSTPFGMAAIPTTAPTLRRSCKTLSPNRPGPRATTWPCC